MKFKGGNLYRAQPLHRGVLKHCQDYQRIHLPASPTSFNQSWFDFLIRILSTSFGAIILSHKPDLPSNDITTSRLRSAALLTIVLAHPADDITPRI